MSADKLVVGLTGMPGSGKSLVVKTAKLKDYQVVIMGDVIREAVANRGLEMNPKNAGKVMLELRSEGGEAVIARKCIPKIEQNLGSKIIIDGIRSLAEAQTFQNHFSNFTLLAVHTPPEIRFKRLSRRGRGDDPQDFDVFHERDMRELTVGLGNAIAMAKYIIMNDSTKEKLEYRVRGVLDKIEEDYRGQDGSDNR